MGRNNTFQIIISIGVVLIFIGMLENVVFQPLDITHTTGATTITIRSSASTGKEDLIDCLDGIPVTTSKELPQLGLGLTEEGKKRNKEKLRKALEEWREEHLEKKKNLALKALGPCPGLTESIRELFGEDSIEEAIEKDGKVAELERWKVEVDKAIKEEKERLDKELESERKKLEDEEGLLASIIKEQYWAGGCTSSTLPTIKITQCMKVSGQISDCSQEPVINMDLGDEIVINVAGAAQQKPAWMQRFIDRLAEWKNYGGETAEKADELADAFGLEEDVEKRAQELQEEDDEEVAQGER
jgi:hypothetical protein